MSEQNFSTGLAKVTNAYAPLIERQLTGNGINMDGYAKQCVLNAISAINTAMEAKNIDWNDPQLDKNNVTQTLLTVACLKLNAAASPREVFFQIRNVRAGRKDEHGRDIWKKQIELGIEGDGNDAILARFGRDIDRVGQFWLVREQDHFEYPVYTGFDVEPPRWSPTGKGDVTRVVYPIKKKDGTVEYYISEREDVARNLIAHINNNLMNETFGICQDRYNANADQKAKIADKKSEILKKARELGLGSLDDKALQKWISPAWTEYQSREAMIIRKMRNNVVKKIPKDFGNAFVEIIHSTATDPEYEQVRREISEHANNQTIDIEYGITNDAGNLDDGAPESNPAPENPDKASQPSKPDPEPEPTPEEPEPVGAGAGGPGF